MHERGEKEEAISAFAVISKLPKKGADKSIAEAKTRKMCYDISYGIQLKILPNSKKKRKRMSAQIDMISKRQSKEGSRQGNVRSEKDE